MHHPLGKIDIGVSISLSQKKTISFVCCWPLNYIGFTHLGSKQEKCWILGVRQLDSAGAVAVPASYSLMLSVKHSVSPSSTTVFSKTRVLSLSRHHVSVPYCGGYSATTLHRITCLNKTKFRHICSVQEAQENLQVTEHERGRWGRYWNVA